MSRRAQENIIAAVLLVVFSGVIWLCQDFGPRARMIPLPLAIFGIVLTVIQILWQNLRTADDLQMNLIKVAGPPSVEKATAATEGPLTGRIEKPEARGGWTKEASAFGIVAVLLGLIALIGLMPAVFLFTAGYFLLTRYYSWRVGLAYTAVFTLTVYLLFVWALQIQPYHGLLAPWVDRFL
jgi:hypothetical protein